MKAHQASRPLSKRSVLACLAAISAVAMILRYPGGHEEGVDSFLIHGVAGAILDTGSMNWLVNPFSYFGLAQFSYAPAVPVSLASFAGISNLGLEPAILAYSLLFGLLTPWTAFLLGREVTRRDGVSLFFAFLVTSCEGMIGFTNWTISTRGTFLVMTPLALALFVKTLLRETPRRTHLTAVLLVLFTLAFTHALSLLLVPSLVAVWLTFQLTTNEESVLRHRLDLERRSRIVLVTAIAAGLLLLGFMETGPAHERLLTNVPQVVGGSILSNPLLEVGLQYATVMGLGIILFPLGVWRVLRYQESRRRYVLIGLSIVFLPSSLDPLYGILLAIPVVLLVAALGLAWHHPRGDGKSRAPPTKAIMVAGVVAALVLLLPPLISISKSPEIPCQESWTLSGQSFDAALYTKYTMPEHTTFVADNGVEADRIEAIAGLPAVEPLEGIGTLEYGWLREKFVPQMTLNPDIVGTLAGNHELLTANEWLSLTGSSYGYYWGKHTFVLLQSTPDSLVARQVVRFYQSRYAIESCPGSQSAFFGGLESTSYVIYADEMHRTFLLPSEN